MWWVQFCQRSLWCPWCMAQRHTLTWKNNYSSLLFYPCVATLKFVTFETWIGRSGGAVSSGFRSLLENANNGARSLFLRLWSCCAIREIQRWQWEEQRSGIRFITGGWLQCPRFQRGITGREVGVGAKGGPDSNSFCLKIWSLFILSYLSGLQR